MRDRQAVDIKDRDKAGLMLRPSRRTFPFIVKAFADASDAGERRASAAVVTVQVERHPLDHASFAMPPRDGS